MFSTTHSPVPMNRMRKNRTFLLALVAVLVVALAAPAFADSLSSARKKREQARTRRAQIAAQINDLEASDAELERAVGALDEQVRAQEAAAADARQAVAAAEAELKAAEERLAATRTEIADLKNVVSQRAIEAYMAPQSNDTFGQFASSSSINDASRKSAILEQTANRDGDVFDRLNEAREDQVTQQAIAESARATAEARRREVEAKLASARSARDEKARLEAAMDARIREYTAEAEAVASQEASLAALIRSKEQVSPASRGGDGGVPGRVSGAGLIWPVSGPVTSEYGYRWGRQHAGIDIGAGTGTPIRASKGGTVIYSGSMSGYGNVVVVDHGGGFSTLYAHMSRVGASDGQSVGQGQVIGYVGSTGNSTGPHLHFETRVNGSPQNPRRYLP